MSSKTNDEWIPYLRTTGPAPVSTLINLRYRSTLPARSLPLVVRVRFRLSNPGESGFGTPAEVERLDAVIDNVVQSAGGDQKLIYVATHRSGGYLYFWLYGDAEWRGSLAPFVEKIAAPLLLEVKMDLDREWSVYKKMLPTAAEERVYKDLMVVRQLQSHGDPLDPPRDVRHYAYFPSESSANSFASNARAKGFKCEVCPSREPKAGSTYFVIASRDDSVQWPGISEVTSLVEGMASAHTGDCDGWEAALVRKQGLLSRLFKRG